MLIEMLLKSKKYFLNYDEELQMGESIDDQHAISELREMIRNKKPGEQDDKIVAEFCERHGFSLEKCRKYYEIVLGKNNSKRR